MNMYRKTTALKKKGLQMTTKLLDRIPRTLSLLGLLGIIGVAGIFDPQLWRFSALSFLSYICYFRFFRWFAKPRPEVTAASIGIWFLGFILGSLATGIYPGLFSVSPMLGFLGFAGFLGLYEPTDASRSHPAI
jgi:hypothetical protein